jgi:hypothetical protein
MEEIKRRRINEERKWDARGRRYPPSYPFIHPMQS